MKPEELNGLEPLEKVKALEVAQDALVFAMVKELTEIQIKGENRLSKHIKIQEVMAGCITYNRMEADINKLKKEVL